MLSELPHEDGVRLDPIVPPANGTTRELARWYLARGWPLFPLHPGRKTPLFEALPKGPDGRGHWAPYRERPPTLTILDGWLRRWPALNLAVITGRCSGIAVLDIDGPEGLASLRAAGYVPPRTLAQRTPGGWHCVYWIDPVGPGIRTVTGLVPHVDVKGEGGCFTAAPSHRAAGRYRWQVLEAIAPAPDWMVTQGPAPTMLPATPAVRPSGAATWVQNALQHGAAEGDRNATATRLAGYFRARRVDEGTTAGILRDYAARCSPPLSEREVETVIRSVGRYPEGNGDGGLLVLS